MTNQEGIDLKHTVKKGSPIQVLSYSIEGGYEVKPATAPRTRTFQGDIEVEMIPGYGGCDVTEVLVPFFPNHYLFTVDGTPYQQVQWLVEKTYVQEK